MSGRESILAHLVATARKLSGATALDVSIVDGSGNQVTSFGGSGGTASTDESAFTAGAGSGTPVMGLFESAPTTLANGQVGVVGLTTDRKLKVSGTFSASPITAGTSALTNVAGSATNVTLLGANANRLAFMLYNDSTSALYVKFGVTASATSFTKRLLPNEAWGTLEAGVNYTGQMDAIWDSAAGTMRVTELTA